ncbi:Lar family restriction alleviation protein [Stenotrophomonas maltophilia]|uniref:Lar family restriction alleviation protein n=1 Tax=Stenotrophomonas maltophilia TaxID=40324 RepID=UPI0021C64B67|nr:Lar family restriction alleviation protein [Stenotrophomonas maltophilia]MCU1169240.1 Lar family restriction alleviation protein [Stenotrophomonas maltophilia]
MSTDKTLADMQPGGMVRLGDALLPCPFCGNDAEFVPYKNNGLTLKCKSMGCIQRHQRTLRYGIDWLRTSMAEHWNTRALSAQPSPGGQDGLVQEALEYFERAGDAGDRQYVAAIRAALAARQPVGEPVIDYEDLVDQAKDLIQCGCSVNGAFDWLLEQLADGEVLAPPAQAVDLSKLIAKIDQAWSYLSTALDDLDSSPDRRPSVMVDEAMGCLRQALTGVPNG